MPTAFIAGATGYTGKVLVAELAHHPEWKARPHARSAGKLPDAVVCDPWDVAALAEGMRGCDAVVQLIGTTRKQFKEGGTYEKVDYGTTVALLQAAQKAGVPRFLLLSSVGAGKPRGSYLQWKRKTEEVVEGSGLEYTLFRPSFISGPGRGLNKVVGGVLGLSSTLRNIDVQDLARAFVRALERRDQVKNKILEGKELWALLA